MKNDRRLTSQQPVPPSTWSPPPPYHVGATETLENLMQRDLDAWLAAKAAIAKAMGA
jgi:hypothetical protein